MLLVSFPLQMWTCTPKISPTFASAMAFQRMEVFKVYTDSYLLGKHLFLILKKMKVGCCKELSRLQLTRLAICITLVTASSTSAWCKEQWAFNRQTEILSPFALFATENFGNALSSIMWRDTKVFWNAQRSTELLLTNLRSMKKTKSLLLSGFKQD